MGMGDDHEIMTFSPRNLLPAFIDFHPRSAASAAASLPRQQS